MMQKNTLLCSLPHAGGSCRSFSNITYRLSNNIQIKALELPGRGERYLEPLCTDLTVIVDDLYHSICETAKKGQQLFIWGHSMGAIVALLLSYKLEKNKEYTFGGLIVSAMAGPSIRNTKQKLHLLPSEEFFQYFVKLMPPIKGNRGEGQTGIMFKRMENIVRADIEALETVNIKDWNQLILNVPIHVLIGKQDEMMTENGGYDSWKLHTKATTHNYLLDGGHFFVLEHPLQTASLIQEIISKSRAENSINSSVLR